MQESFSQDCSLHRSRRNNNNNNNNNNSNRISNNNNNNNDGSKSSANMGANNFTVTSFGMGCDILVL